MATIDLDSYRKIETGINSLTLKCWECSLGLNISALNTSDVSVILNKSVPESIYGEVAGLDLRIILNKKPIKNFIDIPFNPTNITLDPQGPLDEGDARHWGGKYSLITPTDIYDLNGISVVHRPLKMVGAVVLFHNSKGHLGTAADIDKYRSGRIGCLYSFPQTSWSIPFPGILRLNIDQTLLDMVSYPFVLHGSTLFGYSSNGGTSFDLDTTEQYRCTLYNPYTGVTGDTITKFSVYGAKVGTTNRTLDMAAYSIVSGHAAARLAAAITITLTSTTPGWVDSAAISQALVNGTVYGPATGNYSGTSVRLYYDGTSTAPPNNIDIGDAAGALPATFTVAWTYGFKESWTGTVVAGGWVGEFSGVAVAEFDGIVPAEIDGV